MERRSRSAERRGRGSGERRSGSRGRSGNRGERGEWPHSRSLSRDDRPPRDRDREHEERRGSGNRHRSPTPGARAAEEPAHYITWSRDNMELLLAPFADMIKLVEVERLLIAYNARTPSIQRGDVPPFTVLKGLLAGFKYVQHHLGLVERYVVREGEDFLLLQAGEPVGEQAIQLISISNRNLLDSPTWEERGEEEVARLRQVYMRRHGRGMPLDQAAAVAWRRSAALSWFARYRAEEAGLAPHLHRLLDELRDQRELRRMARRFDPEPQSPQAGHPRSGQAAGEQQRERASLSPQQQRQEQQRQQRAPDAGTHSQQQHEQRRGEVKHSGEQRVKLEQQPSAEQPERQQPQHGLPAGGPVTRAAEQGRQADRRLPPEEQHKREEHKRREVQQREQPPLREKAQRQGGRKEEEAEGRARQGSERVERRLREERGKEEKERQRQRDDQRDEKERQRQDNAVRSRSPAPPASSMPAAAPSAAAAASNAAAGTELPPHLAELPPHLVPAAAQGASASPDWAPAFIPLGGAPAGPQGCTPQGGGRAQERRQLAPLNGASGSAGGVSELQAARQAAVAAAARGRDPGRTAGAGDGPGCASVERSTASPVAAGRPHAAPSAPAANSADSGTLAGGKRKRSAIQWEPQPQQDGDAPLQRFDSTGALIKPGKQPKAPAVAAAAPAAAAPAAAKPKAAAPAKPPKSFSITVSNALAARDASPSLSEEGELQPAKVARQDAGPSRLAAAGGPTHHPHAGAAADTTASWRQAQQQQQQQYVPTGAGLSYPSATQDLETAFPPGFGGGDRDPLRAMRAVGARTSDSVTVHVPGPALPGHSGSLQQAQQASHAGGADVLPGMTLLGIAPQQAAAMYAAGMLQPGLPGSADAFDLYGAPLAVAHDTLVPPPATLFFAGASPQQQQQQHYGGIQQLHNDQPGPGDSSPILAVSGDLPPHLLAAAASAEAGTRPSGGGSRRLVQLDDGGDGGGGGRSGGSRRGGSGSGGDGRGGRATTAVAGPACWDPMVAWEVQLIELLKRHPKGLTMEDLHRRHPLPACMPQTIGVLGTYLVLRKQLCSVERGERMGGRRVTAARSAEAWLQYKRSLLQLLADRRPRLDSGIVQRLLALPSRLPDWMHKEAKRDFPAFVAKCLREEVEVQRRPHGQEPLLELRPFAADAGGPGFPRLTPPFNRPCTGERCKYGEKCHGAHAQPRPY